jgi:hypothetical protein
MTLAALAQLLHQHQLTLVFVVFFQHVFDGAHARACTRSGMRCGLSTQDAAISPALTPRAAANAFPDAPVAGTVHRHSWRSGRCGHANRIQSPAAFA